MKKLIQKIASKFGFKLVKPYQRLNQPSPIPQASSSGWANLKPSELRRLFHFEQVSRTQKLSGPIVECGVAGGSSLIFFFHLSKVLKDDRAIWGFDTFEGFPETSKEDGTFLSSNETKQARYRKNTLDTVRDAMSLSGMSNEDIAKTNLVKGIIPDSFASYDGERVSLLNVDVDLYKPTIEALHFFWPLMEKGGVIMLDEYDYSEKDLKKWPGAKIAVDEFCNQYDVRLNRHYCGRVFLEKD